MAETPDEPFQMALTPRYYDFDPSGIVHNTVHVRWLEDGRTAFQDASPWPTGRLYAHDLSAALTRTEIDYLRPLKLSDPVTLRVWVTHVGHSALSLALRLVHPETGLVYARAVQSGCFVRRSTGRPVPMPAEFADYCRASLARVGPPG